MDLQDQFDKAVADSKTLAVKPNNDMLLKLYSLYKQATEGDAGEDEPSNPFDFVGKAKHNAWLGQKGKSKDQSMQEYVDTVLWLKGN